MRGYTHCRPSGETCNPGAAIVSGELGIRGVGSVEPTLEVLKASEDRTGVDSF